MTTNATSFWKFIENHHIEIPIIQRDYVQGREKQEYLRKNIAILKIINLPHLPVITV